GEVGGGARDLARVRRLVHVLDFDPTYRVEPVAMAEPVRAALREELEARGLPVVQLPSGAGHDAGILAAAGVASGMLFVRSLNGGVSHSPEERSDEADVEQGVAVLAGALRRLATAVD